MTEPDSPDSNEVVVILPFIGDKVLMQLRDFNPKIRYPGRWGYFSGAIQEGEQPVQAARRELFEEIGYQSDEMIWLGRIRIVDQNNLMSHVYRCSVRIPLEKLVLHEGLDMALAAKEEILSEKIYSKNLRKFFPIAETSFIAEVLTLALASPLASQR